jgi:hypothetical protein
LREKDLLTSYRAALLHRAGAGYEYSRSTIARSRPCPSSCLPSSLEQGRGLALQACFLLPCSALPCWLGCPLKVPQQPGAFHSRQPASVALIFRCAIHQGKRTNMKAFVSSLHLKGSSKSLNHTAGCTHDSRSLLHRWQLSNHKYCTSRS